MESRQAEAAPTNDKRPRKSSRRSGEGDPTTIEVVAARIKHLFTNNDSKEKNIDYIHRGQWLRAAILGASDGLVSTASLMIGVGAVKHDARSMIVSGLAGLVGGMCSMAIGEFVSVSSQRDAELHEVKAARTKKTSNGGKDEEKGLRRGATSDETKAAMAERGGKGQVITGGGAKAPGLPAAGGGRKVVEKSDYIGEETKKVANADVKTSEARAAEEQAPSAWEAAGASGMAFAVGGLIPLLSGGFISDRVWRTGVLLGVSSTALASFGALAATLGGSSVGKGSARILLGGWAAILITYGVLELSERAGI